jgi:hypothetical protein
MGISYRKYYLVTGVAYSVIPEALQTMSVGLENGHFISLYICGNRMQLRHIFQKHKIQILFYLFDKMPTLTDR